MAFIPRVRVIISNFLVSTVNPTIRRDFIFGVLFDDYFHHSTSYHVGNADVQLAIKFQSPSQNHKTVANPASLLLSKLMSVS